MEEKKNNFLEGAAIPKLMKFYSFKDINEAQAASDRGACIKAVLRMD